MKSGKKGQVEIIVIVAFILIAIVVVIMATQPSVPGPVTPQLPEEAKLVKDSVINLIRAGVKDQLTIIYNQGGTLSPSFSVKFGMFDTAVWSACGESNIPDVSQEIGIGIGAYLRKNLEDEMEFFGKNVEFDFSDSKYEVDIFKDRVNIKVYLPTEVEGYEIPQPYEVSVDTKLYDVLDFSNNFVNDVGESRFFEMVTLTSMVHSNPDHEYWLPVAGVQTGCGNVLFKSRRDLVPAIQGIVKYTVSHVVWNSQPLKLAENPFYPINNVGGKFYPDMDVAFAYPPEWDSELNSNFFFTPEPLRVVPKPIMTLIPICVGPYAVSYNFRYPVVVMVEDPILNQWFKFAIMVDIMNTQPGNCSADFAAESDYSKICITDAECDAGVTVKNSTGDPIEGADVSFYICDLGVTDHNGLVEGKIPCMVSELHVYKEGYRSFGNLYRSDEVEALQVVLKKIEEMTIHVKGVETEGKGTWSNGGYGSYEKKGDPKDITPFDGKDMITFVTFTPTDPNYFTGEDVAMMFTNYDDEGNLVSTIEKAAGLSPLELNVTASVMDNETGATLGHISHVFTLGEGEKDIYVYLPVVTNLGDNEYIDPSEAEELTSMLVNAGITPVATEAS